MACDLKPAFLLAAFCAAAAPALANELVCEPAGFPIVIDVGHSRARPALQASQSSNSTSAWLKSSQSLKIF